MSLQAIRWAMQQQVESGAKLVLIVLADRASNDGRGCILSQTQIAESASMGERTVRRHLIELEQAGLIRRGRRSRKDGSRTSDRYTLRMSSNRAIPQHDLPASLAAGQPAEVAARDNLPADLAGSSPSLPANMAGLVPTVLDPVENNPPVVPPTNGNGDRRPRRTRRCPEDWQPNDEHRALSRDLGVNLEAEIEKLRDHEFKNPYSDWDAVARNWLRNAAEMQAKKKSNGAENLMLGKYDPARVVEYTPPVKTRMQLEHEERIRKAIRR